MAVKGAKAVKAAKMIGANVVELTWDQVDWTKKVQTQRVQQNGN